MSKLILPRRELIKGAAAAAASLALPRHGLAIPGPVPSTWIGSKATTTTFDPAKKSTHLTLSGGNLVMVSSTDSAAIDLVLSVRGHSSGKYYMEYKSVADTAYSYCVGFGIAASTETLTNSSAFGHDAISIALFNGDSTVYVNSANIGTFVSLSMVLSDVLAMAVDLTGRLIWFKLNAGNWNNNGAADPATGTGGFSFTLNAVPYYVVGASASASAPTSGMTVNLGGSAYTYTPPSGFGTW